MKITDVKVGQTVFIMGDGRTRETKFQTYEAQVVKVGRKYVTISGSWKLQFKEATERRPYLVEQTEIGPPRFLFPSQKAVDDYREREELKAWLWRAVGWEKTDRYTLGQLREVKKILDGPPPNGESHEGERT